MIIFKKIMFLGCFISLLIFIISIGDVEAGSIGQQNKIEIYEMFSANSLGIATFEGEATYESIPPAISLTVQKSGGVLVPLAPTNIVWGNNQCAGFCQSAWYYQVPVSDVPLGFFLVRVFAVYHDRSILVDEIFIRLADPCETGGTCIPIE